MSVWILCKSDTQLAVIKPTNIDFPWYIGKFEPNSAFDPYHHLYDQIIRITGSR